MSKTETPDQNIRESILAAVGILWDRHHEAIREVRENTKDKKIRVAFSVVIDESEVEPLVQTQISFSARVKDALTARLDDPNQGGFQFVDKDAETEKTADVDED